MIIIEEKWFTHTQERKFISFGVSSMHLALDLLLGHKIGTKFYSCYDKNNTPCLSIFNQTVSAGPVDHSVACLWHPAVHHSDHGTMPGV